MSASMKNILVIGGTSGIGEAFVKRFHSMGKKVIVTGRREQRLSELQKSLSGLETQRMDMTDLTSIPKDVETLFSRFPNIDTVWVNGGLQYSSSIKDPSSSSDARVSEEVTLNVTAPIIIARHVIPCLLAQKNETQFMITSSGLGFVPNKMFPIYCPTKSAIHAYMVAIRQDLLDTNVNVIEIVPPFVGGTELNPEQMETMLKAVKPLPMEDYVNETFKKLEESPAKDLREVAAGSANDRVQAWRDGTGEFMKKSGISG